MQSTKLFSKNSQRGGGSTKKKTQKSKKMKFLRILAGFLAVIIMLLGINDLYFPAIWFASVLFVFAVAGFDQIKR